MNSTVKRDRERIDWKAERERIDLADVATDLLGPAPGRRGDRSRRLWWICPFHEDRNPSFYVNPGKPWWKCYGCGESGDAADLVMRVQSKTFPEALAYLIGRSAHTRLRSPRKAPAEPTLNPPPKPSKMLEADALALVDDAAARLWTSEGAAALAYLTGPKRCLAPETIHAARLGWTPRADGVPWKPPGVVIPWFIGDRLALAKVRPDERWCERLPDKKRPPKYLEAFRDPARLVCYPSPATVRPGRPLVVVEGEFDALVLGEALGDLAAVVTLGSASAELTPAIIGRFLTATPWYVSPDNDQAGGLAASKWKGYGRARIVRLPPRYKDWTEAKADGVNLARWWADMFSGRGFRRDGREEMAPELFTNEEATGLRWGPALEDDEPGINIL